MWLDDIADLRRSEMLIITKQQTAELRGRSLLSTSLSFFVHLEFVWIEGASHQLYSEQCLSISAANNATASTMMRRHRAQDESILSGKSRSTSIKTRCI